MTALTAGQLINDLLQGPNRASRPRDVIGEACEAIAKYEPPSDLNAAEIARMVKEPWRIADVVYGVKEWPVMNPHRAPNILRGERLKADAVLFECRRHIDAMIEAGRSNHWTYDRNRLATLRQAEAALVRLIGRAA